MADVLVPSWFKISWLVLLVMVGLQFLFLVFMSLMTPAMTFLKAKFTKQPLIYIVGRDQRARFARGKVQQSGIADVKGVGPFILSERSHTIDTKSGLPIFYAFAGYAATPPPDWVAVMERLREMGFELNYWRDYDMLVKASTGKKPKLDVQVEKDAWEKLREVLRSLSSMDTMTDEEMLEQASKLQLEIIPARTFKLHDLVNMFPYTLTPELVESQTQYKLQEQRRRLERISREQAMIYLMILFGFALASFIAYKFLKSDSQTCRLELPPGLLTGVQVAAQNLTG